MIGSGIGVTPLISIWNHLVSVCADAGLDAAHPVKNVGDIPVKKETATKRLPHNLEEK